jgi:hypothetical protein
MRIPFDGFIGLQDMPHVVLTDPTLKHPLDGMDLKDQWTSGHNLPSSLRPMTFAYIVFDFIAPATEQ